MSEQEPNFFKEYWKFHNAYENNHMKSIENHIQHYETIEELLGFQYWLNEKTAAIYNADSEYSETNFSEATSHSLFSLNLLSIYAAFMTAQKGLMNQTITNIRTVYESIPKMYYLSFFPEECGKIILREHTEGIKDPEAREVLQSSKVSDIFSMYNLSYSEDLLQELRKKYNFAWFRDQIYSSEQIISMKKTYRLFSTSSHPSIVRISEVRKHSKEEVGDIFDLIEFLSFFNILAMFNGHRNMVSIGKFPTKETMKFSEKIRQKLVDQDENMRSLFPDKPEIINKLMISPPRPPFHSE